MKNVILDLVHGENERKIELEFIGNQMFLMTLLGKHSAKISLSKFEITMSIYNIISRAPKSDNKFDVTKQKIEELWNFFQEASMMPHKFASNEAAILDSIPENNRN